MDMIQRFFNNEKFFLLLFKFDSDIAEKVKHKKCLFCNSSLHQANYERQPRGNSLEKDDYNTLRLSFCCYKCRKRFTPPSFRFLGRKVFFSAIMILISAMLGDASAQRIKRLRKIIDADARTLSRWRKWWNETFIQSDLWKSISDKFSLFDQTLILPRSIIRNIKISPLQNLLIKLLQMLLPMTGGTRPQLSTISYAF